MTNPVTAILGTISTISSAITVGVEGTSAYLELWRNNQKVAHKYSHKTYSLECLAEHGLRATKAKEAISELDPEVIAYLEN